MTAAQLELFRLGYGLGAVSGLALGALLATLVAAAFPRRPSGRGAP